MHARSLTPRPGAALSQAVNRHRLILSKSTGLRRGLKERCSAAGGPSTAREAVETGLATLKDDKNPAKALKLFQEALDLRPDEEEMRAAVYNSACCYTKLNRFSEAAEAVKDAVNLYGLKLSVALEVG